MMPIILIRVIEEQSHSQDVRDGIYMTFIGSSRAKKLSDMVVLW